MVRTTKAQQGYEVCARAGVCVRAGTHLEIGRCTGDQIKWGGPLFRTLRQYRPGLTDITMQYLDI